MEITEIGNGQQPIGQTARAPVLVDRGNTRSGPDHKVSTYADQATTSVARSQLTFGRLQVINDHSNREALRIRTEEQKALRADQLLAEMKETLYQVIKNYPPYSSGNPERAKFLMSFNGLKREIEQMTIPPDSRWLGGSTGEINLPEETASGPLFVGSDIPTLDQQATNIELQFAIRQINQASSALPAPAASSAASNAAGGVSQEKRAVLATIEEQDLDLSIPDKAEAEETSTRARQDLAGAMNGTLTAAKSQLLALAG